jgi:AraC-like DNA-binding protein
MVQPMDQINIPYRIRQSFEALGIEPTRVLQQARLPQTLFQQERLVVTTAQWLALWDAVASLNDDPALGLSIRRLLEGGPYDPLLITALSAQSFHAALNKVVRYKRLFAFEEIRIQEHDGAWMIEVRQPDSSEPVPALLVDATFTCIVDIARRGTGRSVYPERIMFRRNQHHQALYEAFFQCPVEFGADHDMALYRHEVMQMPFLTYNPDLLALLEPQLEAELRDRTSQTTFSEQVKTLVRSRLAGSQPAAQAVAGELGMSVRSLQRRLATEGLRFQQLVESERHELAKQYLRESALELKEIAFCSVIRRSVRFTARSSAWKEARLDSGEPHAVPPNIVRSQCLQYVSAIPSRRGISASEH